MPWKVSHMEEERFKFVMEVQKNERSFMALCREFGISRPTGYKWWKRYSEVRDPEVLKDLSRAAQFKNANDAWGILDVVF